MAESDCSCLSPDELKRLVATIFPALLEILDYTSMNPKNMPSSVEVLEVFLAKQLEEKPDDPRWFYLRPQDRRKYGQKPPSVTAAPKKRTSLPNHS